MNSNSSTTRSFLFGVGVGVVVAAAVTTTTWHRLIRQRRRRPAPRRFGGTIRLRQGQYRRYRELHDNVWRPVLQRMYESNMRNFTIYYHEETSTLFFYFEWIGHWKKKPRADFSSEEERRWFNQDMEAVNADPVTRQWWAECEPCQRPFSQWLDRERNRPPSQGGTEGQDWWAQMECVAHCGYWPTTYSDQMTDPDFVKLAGRETKK